MVTVSTSRRTYHHGELRSALIGAALATVEAADELSLRGVARRVGVSATAVYRHFPDKAALMAAVAAAGLDRLGIAQRAAYDAAGGGEAGFAATGVAYVAFALDNPALFRLVYARHRSAAQPLMTGDDEATSFLVANAAALAPSGVEPTVFALQAWSLAHGVAMLMLDGQMPSDLALAERIIDIRALYAGRPPRQ